jgi:hypothetical protein
MSILYVNCMKFFIIIEIFILYNYPSKRSMTQHRPIIFQNPHPTALDLTRVFKELASAKIWICRAVSQEFKTSTEPSPNQPRGLSFRSNPRLGDSEPRALVVSE